MLSLVREAIMSRQPKKRDEFRLVGVPVSPGIAIGRICVQLSGKVLPEVYDISREDVAHEMERLERALSATSEQLRALRERISELSGEDAAKIFDAHVLFLNDRTLLKQITEEIESSLHNIEAVFYEVVHKYINVLRQVDDPYLKSRTSDFEDIMHRVIQNMLHAETQGSCVIADEEHIIISHDLTPSDTASLNISKVLGFATEQGSAISHTAILARSMGVPAVMGLPGLIQKCGSVQEVILDGYRGEVVLNPTRATIKKYERIHAEKLKAYKALEAMRDLPTETLDGKHIRLAVNVEYPYEFNGINESGAEGVGLFRTEFFLLGDQGRKMPGEDEQYKWYSELVEGCAPNEVVFRTLDAGGDKVFGDELEEPEPNPFLGWRGIRISLSCREMFKDQIKAILRASAHGKASILFPMVSGRTEIIRAKGVIDECKRELDKEGQAYDKNIKVGIMIEVPSAAILADILAEEVDYFSIGTNDLTQYALAVDRINNLVSRMFRPTHPAVIRLVNMTVKAGDNKGIPTTVCGEMASDILLLPLLIGLGINEVSVGIHMVPIVRYAIRHLKLEDCRVLAQKALKAPDSNTILALSSEAAKKAYPALFE